MNRFVIAEASKCIGCRTCEIACALAHQTESAHEALTPATFSPRLTVVRNARVTAPVLCRQCDDAPCQRACPSGAITYGADSVLVNQSRCVGCKSCVVACPFGAMNVVTVAAEAPAGAVYGTQRHVSRALKCDLCETRPTGPACIPACPTKALHMIDKDRMAATQLRRQQQAALDIPAGVQF